jgi:ubiquinone/menaquinone biosynthesis C-methylase UbiE
MNKSNNLIKVKKFWDKLPLFVGESKFATGSDNFFNEHDKVIKEKVFYNINEIYRKVLFPKNSDYILDAGCGTGFWTKLFKNELNNITIVALDLSKNSLNIAKKRFRNKKNIKFVLGNIENLNYPDLHFDHINCQGVIHHTPNTQKAVNELFRVLKAKGTASISVYYKNFIIKNYKYLKIIVKIFSFLFINLGRGRLSFHQSNYKNIIKLYDGKGNPVGKAYTQNQFHKILTKSGFNQIEFTYYFFPFRFLKIKLPLIIIKIFTHFFPFMMVANIRK